MAACGESSIDFFGGPTAQWVSRAQSARDKQHGGVFFRVGRQPIGRRTCHPAHFTPAFVQLESAFSSARASCPPVCDRMRRSKTNTSFDNLGGADHCATASHLLRRSSHHTPSAIRRPPQPGILSRGERVSCPGRGTKDERDFGKRAAEPAIGPPSQPLLDGAFGAFWAPLPTTCTESHSESRKGTILMHHTPRKDRSVRMSSSWSICHHHYALPGSLPTPRLDPYAARSCSAPTSG